MEVEVNGGAVRIGFGDDTEPVLEVLDVSAFLESLQRASSIDSRIKPVLKEASP
jgi:hypothetical protein